MNLRFDFQWPAAVIFTATIATLGALVYLGKLSPEVLMALVAWLIPGPYQTKARVPSPVVSSSPENPS